MISGHVFRWLRPAGSGWTQRFDINLGEDKKSLDPALSDERLIHKYLFRDLCPIGPSVIYRRNLPIASEFEAASYFMGNTEALARVGPTYIQASEEDAWGLSEFLGLLAANLPPGSSSIDRLVRRLSEMDDKGILGFHSRLLAELANADLVSISRRGLVDLESVEIAKVREALLSITSRAGLPPWRFDVVRLAFASNLAWERKHSGSRAMIVPSGYSTQEPDLSNRSELLETFYDSWDREYRELTIGPMDRDWDLIAASGQSIVIYRILVHLISGEWQEILLHLASSPTVPDEQRNERVAAHVEAQLNCDLHYLEAIDTHSVRYSATNYDIYRITTEISLPENEFLERIFF